MGTVSYISDGAHVVVMLTVCAHTSYGSGAALAPFGFQKIVGYLGKV